MMVLDMSAGCKMSKHKQRLVRISTRHSARPDRLVAESPKVSSPQRGCSTDLLGLVSVLLPFHGSRTSG